ncbi:hypothetical protein [Streptomyces sp. BBFR109]|uniref:hypothetical protein n=1 Tax=Streptomyces sp. BBFR109 TaxID=3448172 RepID=UPI003F75E86F
MTTPANADADSKQLFEALTHGVAGDDETAWALIGPLVRRDDTALYGVVCGLAESAAFDTLQQHGPGNFVLEVEHLDTGAEGSTDDLPPGVRFATQFVTAWANRDHDTAEALYLALYRSDPDALGVGVRALYEMAVVSLRAFCERKRKAQGQT